MIGCRCSCSSNSGRSFLNDGFKLWINWWMANSIVTMPEQAAQLKTPVYVDATDDDWTYFEGSSHFKERDFKQPPFVTLKAERVKLELSPPPRPERDTTFVVNLSFDFLQSKLPSNFSFDWLQALRGYSVSVDHRVFLLFLSPPLSSVASHTGSLPSVPRGWHVRWC